MQQTSKPADAIRTLSTLYLPPSGALHLVDAADSMEAAFCHFLNAMEQVRNVRVFGAQEGMRADRDTKGGLHQGHVPGHTHCSSC